jgi:hypothetical protein
LPGVIPELGGNHPKGETSNHRGRGIERYGQGVSYQPQDKERPGDQHGDHIPPLFPLLPLEEGYHADDQKSIGLKKHTSP